MDQFKCSKCGEYHKVETLVEFPKPAIGKHSIEGHNSINYITKDSFIVDKKLAMIKCLISIPLMDDPFGDTLDIYSWVSINIAELVNAAKENRDEDKMLLDGSLYHVLPDFQNENAIKVRICLSGKVSDDVLVTEVLSKGKLRDAFQKGMTMERLSQLLEKIIHATV